MCDIEVLHWRRHLMREKFISELLGGSVDQTLTEFRQLAADVRYDGYRRVACRRPSPTASLSSYP
jgi:hypothetical protein